MPWDNSVKHDRSVHAADERFQISAVWEGACARPVVCCVVLSFSVRLVTWPPMVLPASRLKPCGVKCGDRGVILWLGEIDVLAFQTAEAEDFAPHNRLPNSFTICASPLA